MNDNTTCIYRYSRRPPAGHPPVVRACLRLTGLLCLLLTLTPALAHDADQQSGHTHISSVSMLSDPSGTLTAEQVRQRGRAGAFIPLDGPFNQGYSNDVWWLRVTLEPASQDTELKWLEVGPAYLDDVQLYYLIGNELQLLDHQGDRQSFADRPLPWRQSLFLLPDEIWQSGIIYLRLQSSSALSADITLWDNSSFLRQAGQEVLFYSLFASLGALLSLTSLILWRLLKQQNFLCFGIYILSLTGVAMLFEGMVHYLLLPQHGVPLEGWQIALQVIVVISMARLFFGIAYSGQQPPAPRWLSALLSILPIVATLPALLGQSGHSIQLLWLLFVSYFIFFGVTILVRNWRQQRQSDRSIRLSDWLYGIAFSSISVPVAIRIQVIFGFAEPGLISNHILLISIAAYVFMLYAALITHYSESIADLREAEASALAAIIESEQRLEGEVRQRTIELNDSQHQLQQQLQASEQQRSELIHTRQQLDQALDAERAAGEAHGDFLRLVAHEFRTPLSVIDTACSLIEQHAHPASLNTNVHRIRQASDSMRQLVDQALTEDKLNIAAWRCNSAWVSLADLLASSVEQGRRHAHGRQRIILQVATTATVQGDPDMLRLLFINLIDNAIKYSPANSTIYVRLDSPTGNQPRVSVTDQGPGIDPAALAHVTEKFYRGPQAQQHSGLGLGLYLVKRAANLHQATLRIDNLPAGGACISVTFPAVAATPDRPALTEESPG